MKHTWLGSKWRWKKGVGHCSVANIKGSTKLGKFRNYTPRSTNVRWIDTKIQFTRCYYIENNWGWCERWIIRRSYFDSELPSLGTITSGWLASDLGNKVLFGVRFCVELWQCFGISQELYLRLDEHIEWLGTLRWQRINWVVSHVGTIWKRAKYYI